MRVYEAGGHDLACAGYAFDIARKGWRLVRRGNGGNPVSFGEEGVVRQDLELLDCFVP